MAQWSDGEAGSVQERTPLTDPSPRPSTQAAMQQSQACQATGAQGKPKTVSQLCGAFPRRGQGGDRLGKRGHSQCRTAAARGDSAASTSTGREASLGAWSRQGRQRAGRTRLHEDEQEQGQSGQTCDSSPDRAVQGHESQPSISSRTRPQACVQLTGRLLSPTGKF